MTISRRSKAPPSETPLRMDMPRMMAMGSRAFEDGISRHDYPLQKRTPGHSEWLQGWDRAAKAKEARESKEHL